MPWENIWESRGLVIRFSGEVTLEDFTSSGLDAYEEPRFADIDYLISDFSRISGITVGAAEVRRIAEGDRSGFERNPRLKLAIIAGASVVRGLTNMYKVYLETAGAPWALKLFDDEASARRWLGQPVKGEGGEVRE